jgi:protein phosphatase
VISVTSSTPVLEVAVRTDTGLRRKQNEDWLLAADPCFLVADGMGGYEAGDEASRAAIGAFSEEFTAPGPATLESIESALERARREVAEIAAAKERGAGCTLTGIVRIEHEGSPAWYVLNIGDSRVYLLRGSRFEQLTKDHSLRTELLDAGSSEAETTPRNVITRALGSEDTRHDAWLLPVETGTRLLVCSDGLTSEVDDQQLQAVLSAGGRPEAVSDELLRRALDAGGRDNITLIVADVISGGVAPSFEEGMGDDDTLDRTRPRLR